MLNDLLIEDCGGLSDEALSKRVVEGLCAGAQALVDVGMALQEIQRRRDYSTTFEDFIAENFQMTRGRAYQLIYAAEVVLDLAEVFEMKQLPQNESAVRPLVALAKEQRIEVWRQALQKKRSPGHGTVQAIVKDFLQAGQQTSSATSDRSTPE